MSLRALPQRTRPPCAVNVVRGPRARDLEADIDWSAWYLTDEDDMGEGCEQGEIIRILLASLAELARLRAWRHVYIGADNFFAWVESHPLVRVSPDVYLLRDPPGPPLPRCWETWRPGHRPPWVAFEIVSTDWHKDYELAPQKYAQLGASELWIFDPEAVSRPGPGRAPLQGFRRSADGAFVACHAGAAPARSIALDATLVVAPEGPAPRLRLSLEDGTLVPTTEEAREAEARARQAEARAREAEARAREAAEREVERLRAELGRLRGPSPAGEAGA